MSVPFLVSLWQSAVAVLTCWYNFDGVNEYLNMGNVLDFDRTDSFSFSKWVRFDSLSGNQMILTKQSSSGLFRGYALFKDTSNKLRFTLISSGTNLINVNGTQSVSSNTWYHIAVTYDGSSSANGVQIYIDGVALTMNTTTNSLTNTTLNNNLFKLGDRVGLAFEGDMDEVSIYNAEISATDVSDINTLGRTNPDLTTIGIYNTNGVSHWRMAQSDTFSGGNWTVVDEFGTNTGTSVNMDELNKECE